VLTAPDRKIGETHLDGKSSCQTSGEWPGLDCISLAGQAVGIKEVDDGIWLRSFMDYDSVRPKTVTYEAGTKCYPCVRVGPRIVGGPARIRTWDQRIMSSKKTEKQ